jgi:hypothetical protein
MRFNAPQERHLTGTVASGKGNAMVRPTLAVHGRSSGHGNVANTCMTRSRSVLRVAFVSTNSLDSSRISAVCLVSATAVCETTCYHGNHAIGDTRTLVITPIRRHRINNRNVPHERVLSVTSPKTRVMLRCYASCTSGSLYVRMRDP